MQTVKRYFESKKLLIMALAAAMIGVLVGYGLHGDDLNAGHPEANANRQPDMIQPVFADDHAVRAQSEIKDEETIYICPMNCVPPMKQPGKCPVCGMELVAVDARQHRHEEGPPRLRLAAEAVKAAGIQVAAVESRLATAEIRLFGKIEYDPANQYKVTAFGPGVIDEIYVTRAGQTVRRGDALFDLYSLELYLLEQELFETLAKLPGYADSRQAGGQTFKRWVQPWMWPAAGSRVTRTRRPGRSSARRDTAKESETGTQEERKIRAEISRIRLKIRLLGLPESHIDRVIERGAASGISTVLTPLNGIVLNQDAFKGMYLNTGASVFTIANPQYVWAKFEAFASDYTWIRVGQEAEFRVDAYPGETFRGQVIYLDPYFDEKTHTFDVGVACTDHKDKLKPEMLARGVVYATLSSGTRMDVNRKEDLKKVLVIPEAAPLITGKRAIVYVEAPGEPGSFEARAVILGPRTKGWYVVRHGLREGDRVVVNGNFKIDSAVQILAGPSMMEHTDGESMTMHRHPASQ